MQVTGAYVASGFEGMGTCQGPESSTMSFASLSSRAESHWDSTATVQSPRLHSQDSTLWLEEAALDWDCPSANVGEGERGALASGRKPSKLQPLHFWVSAASPGTLLLL